MLSRVATITLLRVGAVAILIALAAGWIPESLFTLACVLGAALLAISVLPRRG